MSERTKVLSSRVVALEIWERMAGFLPPIYSPNGGTCPPSIIAAADAIVDMTASSTEMGLGVSATTKDAMSFLRDGQHHHSDEWPFDDEIRP